MGCEWQQNQIPFLLISLHSLVCVFFFSSPFPLLWFAFCYHTFIRSIVIGYCAAQKALNNEPENVRLWHSESSFIVCRYIWAREEKKNSANKKENERRTENAARIDKGKKQIPFYSRELKPIEMFDSLPNEKMKKKKKFRAHGTTNQWTERVCNIHS